MRKITKNTCIKDAKAELEAHSVPLFSGWEMEMAKIFRECDYITIHGSGNEAKLKKHFFTERGENNETAKETNSPSERDTFKEWKELSGMDD